ncbi:unnamed protein product [Clavelina lepadiformis]|uniref:VWFA domain-containing protein n=1 Tax=Clavelina lepadiformis TaxID=159417 RepID=A0ABP0F4C5_CLALP
MLKNKHVFTLVAALGFGVSAFNVETQKNVTRFFRSPEYEAFLNENKNTSQSGDFIATFYGYQLQIGPLSRNRLIVGAPKASDSVDPMQTISAPKGNIISCLIRRNFWASDFANPSCSALGELPEAKKGDNAGQILQVLPNGQLVTCSTARVQECPRQNNLPGYCFRRSDSWQPDDHTRNIVCSANLEIIFLLDSSASITEENFPTIINWTKNLTQNFNIEDNSTLIGVNTYSGQLRINRGYVPLTETEIPLGTYNDHSALEAAIDKIEYEKGGRTYTASALRTTADQFSTSAARKVLVLLTDGRATDDESLTDAADDVRSRGILTFAVGVGRSDRRELRDIATGTDSDERVYEAEFNTLSTIVDQLNRDIVTALEGGSSSSNSTNGFTNAQVGFSLSQYVSKTCSKI